MHDDLTAAARRHLDEGRGLDAVLAELHAADLGTIQRIQALRAVTELGLQDAIKVIEAAREGQRLAHLTRAHVGLILRARSAAYGEWWTNFYCDAVLTASPWLTAVPGQPNAAQGLGSVYFWALPDLPPTAATWLHEFTSPASTAQRQDLLRRLESDPELARSSPGLISGPGVRFEDLRGDLRSLREHDPFWREHAELTRDTDLALTCRFRVEP